MSTVLSPIKSCHGCHLSLFCLPHPKTCDIAQSLPIKKRIHLQKNEVLFSPNKPFEYLFSVEQGAIKTIQFEIDGAELIRGFYFSGEILGYKAIYSGRYQSTAVALCETNICVIDYKDFLYFLQSNPELQQHILYLISLQLNVGSYLVSTSAERKFAAFLLDLSQRLRAVISSFEFELPMSRQDIANYLRLTPETISRISTRLQQKNIIVSDHKKIRILEPQTLQKIAEGQALAI